MKKAGRFGAIKSIVLPVVTVISFVSLTVIYSLSFAESSPMQGKIAATLHSVADISKLKVAKQDIRACLEDLSYEVETLNFKVDPDSIFIYPAPEGYDYLAVKNLGPAFKPGEPQLPMQTFVVKLDGDAEVYGVELIGGKFSEIDGDINIIPMPQPSKWRTGAKGGKYIPDSNVYSLAMSFPGKLLKYEVGSDGKNTYVYVRVFPVQYVPAQKKAYVVTEAAINVYYGHPETNPSAGKKKPPTDPPDEPDPPTGNMTLTTAQCVIICPDSLETVANALVAFHASEGISSEVVTTEAISAAYSPAEDPPFSGYKDTKLRGWRNIDNYAYTVAKEIIAYLRDNAAHPNLEYVTILGDGLLVPPSYYYSTNGGFHDDWIPSDFLYTSPDYDFTPNFYVGRLSINDATEASTLINKISNWYANADWSWFRKAYLAGGDPLPEHYCSGELNIIQAVNAEFFSGMDLHKCFRTDGVFTTTAVVPAFSTADAGIVYFIGHGSGDVLVFDDGLYTVDELLAHSPHLDVPVVVSVGCNTGNFDVDLMDHDYLHSFGEAVLKSQAGGIAYIGAARESVGDSIYHYSQGNVVVTKLTYVIEMVHNVIGSYHSGKNTLGEISTDALTAYTTNNDMQGDVINVETVFRHVLLGDSALMVPQQQSVAEYQKANATAVNPAGYDPEDIPYYTSIPVVINAVTDSPTVKWKLIDADSDTTLDNVIDYGPSPNFSYTSGSSTKTLYLIRAASEAAASSTDYAKENWLFYDLQDSGGSSLVMHVANIDMSLKQQGPFTNAIATVTIVDETDTPVSGATVSGQWSGLTSDTDSDITGGNGEVELSSDKLRDPVGTFTFCVTDVVLSGSTYDPDANVETCDNITVQ